MIGRSGVIPVIFRAIALASLMPIQIGRYRSAVFSLRMTTCWPVGMWTRMLSTVISMRSAMAR